MAVKIGEKCFLLDENGQPQEEVQVASMQKVRELREERLRRKTP